MSTTDNASEVENATTTQLAELTLNDAEQAFHANMLAGLNLAEGARPCAGCGEDDCVWRVRLDCGCTYTCRANLPRQCFTARLKKRVAGAGVKRLYNMRPYRGISTMVAHMTGEYGI